MKAFALTAQDFNQDSAQILSRLYNCVVAANIPNFQQGSGFLWRKGHMIERDEPDLATKIRVLAEFAPPGYQLHLLQLEEGDITEDEAGLQLAKLVAGEGIYFTGPSESRVNLHARHRGLLKVDVDRLEELNEISGVAVFTLFNDQAVVEGAEVAGAKVTPLVYPAANFAEIKKLAAGSPIVDVLPFQKRKIGVVYREMLQPKARARFEQSVAKKLSWFGAEILGVVMAKEDDADLTVKLNDFKARGADLILHVGGHSSDPLDHVFTVMAEQGIKMARQGAPAHPGTLFWLADWDDTTIFGLASCGMFSKTTLGDLFLAKFCAGEHLTSRDIARLGHGGLFTREMAFRFPPYGIDSSQD